jgi:hypothetical protein
VSDDNCHFDLADYTPDRALARIGELRIHLRDELLPAAEARSDTLVADFIRYLDAWALHFENQLHAPLEFLAFVTRNVLEFALLMPVVFESTENRALFLNEGLRLDADDLRKRVSDMFIAIDASSPDSSIEDMDWLPRSKVRMSGKKDVFDAWLYKFCSKLMHPTAIMVLAPQALTDPEKRLTLCFAGVQYLGRSYNFLSSVLSST